MIIRGKEYSFSATKPKDLLKWDAARKAVAEKYKNVAILAAIGMQEPEETEADKPVLPEIPEIKGMSELQIQAFFLEECIRAMTDLMDGVLGEGACNEIFGPEIDDFLDVVDVYDEFIAGLDAQGAALAEHNKKYQPDEEQ